MSAIQDEVDLRYDVIEDSVPPGPDPKRVISWLAGGLVVALVAVVGLGAWVYSDHRQTTPGLTTSQVAAVAAVNASLAAQNANDYAALAKYLTKDVSWIGVGGGVIGDGPVVGRQAYVDMIKSAGGVKFTKLADPVVASDTVVAVPLIVSVGGLGVCVFTVRNDGGTVKVSEMVWIPDPSFR
jgi:hypothetical protein